MTPTPAPPYRILQLEDGRVVDQIETVEDLHAAHELQGGYHDRLILGRDDQIVPPKHHMTPAEWRSLDPGYRAGNPSEGTARAVMRDSEGRTVLVQVHVSGPN